MSWHVIVSEFKQEYVAQDSIHELGLETFLPKMRRITRSHHRFADPFILIFPGYLFVQWDDYEDRRVWPAIRRQRGVKAILGLNADCNHVIPINDSDFNRLQELATEMSLPAPLVNGRPKPLPPETMIKVLWDAMPGAIGKIEFDNGIRADVLLSAAGVASKISLPRELIEAL